MNGLQKILIFVRVVLFVHKWERGAVSIRYTHHSKQMSVQFLWLVTVTKPLDFVPEKSIANCGV